jgi:hypothetical protein
LLPRGPLFTSRAIFRIVAEEQSKVLRQDRRSCRNECKATGNFDVAAIVSAERADAHARHQHMRVRWIASDPHVPLAVSSRRGGVEAAPGNACTAWGRLGSKWLAIDAFGQIAGHARVTSAERYDVTHCDELGLTAADGTTGVGLFASDDTAWTAPPSARFTPASPELASFDDFAARASDLVSVTLGRSRDALFFAIGAERLAVVGGGALVVGTLGADGSWHAAHMETPTLPHDAMRPLAVVDMDGDGTPEIVFHLDQPSSPSFEDRVLGRAPGDVGWRVRVEGMYGTTL